jgi:O-methyltransferase involved in polyketide biosynthesis
MQQTLACPDLRDIPETMLWALHERATEAMRERTRLRDAACVRIYTSLAYDFHGKFGVPTGLAAARAVWIDHALRRWLARHPAGVVVSLGEGLETQAWRVDNGTMRWLSIDLPEAIRIRERFLQPTKRFRHLAMSAFDPAWMGEVDSRGGVMVVAQGLLMYFKPALVRELFVRIAAAFPGGQMIFDLVPSWVSEANRAGHQVTSAYTSPSMPWGLDRSDVESTLRSWYPELKWVRCSSNRAGSSRPEFMEKLLDSIPVRARRRPSIAHVAF